MIRIDRDERNNGTRAPPLRRVGVISQANRIDREEPTLPRSAHSRTPGNALRLQDTIYTTKSTDRDPNGRCRFGRKAFQHYADLKVVGGRIVKAECERVQSSNEMQHLFDIFPGDFGQD